MSERKRGIERDREEERYGVSERWREYYIIYALITCPGGITLSSTYTTIAMGMRVCV